MILQMWAEEADLLTILMHHFSNISCPLYFSVSKGSFDVMNIWKRGVNYIFLSCFHVELFLQLQTMGKSLSDKICAGNIEEYMENLLDLWTTKKLVIRRSIAILLNLQYTRYYYKEKFVATCLPVKQQLDWSNQKLFLQKREQLYSIHCNPVFKTGTGCFCKACLWPLKNMDGL